MKIPPVSSSSATTTAAAAAAPRAAAGARGRYLPRHRARIIERDNLLLVEFLEPPLPSLPPPPMRRRHAAAPALPLPAWHVALLWGVSLSALTLELLRLLL